MLSNNSIPLNVEHERKIVLQARNNTCNIQNSPSTQNQNSNIKKHSLHERNEIILKPIKRRLIFEKTANISSTSISQLPNDNLHPEYLKFDKTDLSSNFNYEKNERQNSTEIDRIFDSSLAAKLNSSTSCSELSEVENKSQNVFTSQASTSSLLQKYRTISVFNITDADNDDFAITLKLKKKRLPTKILNKDSGKFLKYNI